MVEWPVKGMLLADNAGTLAKDRLSAVKGISTDPSAARSGTLTLQMFYTCTCMLQQLIIKSFVTAGLPVSDIDSIGSSEHPVMSLQGASCDNSAAISKMAVLKPTSRQLHKPNVPRPPAPKPQSKVFAIQSLVQSADMAAALGIDVSKLSARARKRILPAVMAGMAQGS